MKRYINIYSIDNSKTILLPKHLPIMTDVCTDKDKDMNIYEAYLYVKNNKMLDYYLIHLN